MHADTPVPDDEGLIQVRVVAGKDIVRPGNLAREGDGGETKEDDAGVGEALADQQVAKIAVAGNENAPLAVGKRRYRRIRQRPGQSRAINVASCL